MKKLVWLVILLITLYGVLIFLNPQLSDKIENLLGFGGFGEKVRTIGGGFNETVTDIPTVDELKQGYNDAVSGAIDAKNTVVDGIHTTKDTIDTIRSTLSGAEDTYNKAKDVFNETTEKIEKVKGALEDIEELSESITDLVNTGAIQ